MKLAAWLLIFLLGAAAGAAALSAYWYWRHSATEVWVVTRVMKSDNGIILTPGTELTFNTWMPEGFAALELGINVEGDTLDYFERRTEQASFLRIPYFVYSENE